MSIETKGNKWDGFLSWDFLIDCYISYLLLQRCVLYRSKAVFNNPGEEDIGIYSCHVTHTDGASASYTFSEEGVPQRTI